MTSKNKAALLAQLIDLWRDEPPDNITAADGRRMIEDFVSSVVSWAYNVDPTGQIALDLLPLLTPDKLDANTPDKQLAFRTRIGATAGLSLPAGAAGQDTLRYNIVDSAWEAVSVLETPYVAVLRGDTFADISAALTAYFAAGEDKIDDWQTDPDSGIYVESSISRYAQFATWTTSPYGIANQVLKLQAYWPVGEESPYLWLLLPRYYGGIGNYQIGTISQVRGGPIQPIIYSSFFTKASYGISISGVPYDVGIIQLPVPNRNPFNVNWVLRPPVVSHIITQLTP